MRTLTTPFPIFCVLATPMAALGSVASIIAVVQIAGSVAKLCGGYIADVNDARQDIERLQKKAATLRDILQRVAEENDETDLNPRLLSDNVLKSITQCLLLKYECGLTIEGLPK